MGSKRVCPHTITLYNYMGEDASGNAKYARTLLKYVHTHINEGMGSGDVSEDKTRIHIFDDTVESNKPFLKHSEWTVLSDAEKVKFWTLCPEGKDYFAQGDIVGADTDIVGEPLPTDVVLFRIMLISRLIVGTKRMHHWRIEAR